jgi:hypothetical protein
MARKIETFLIDDLDGSQAASTIQFGLDGTQYEIDLSPHHASDLRNTLTPYIDAGRRTGQRKPARNPRSRDDLAAVRAWAAGQGLQVAERGRISAEVIRKYEAAH